MIGMVRRGESQRAVARKFRVSLHTVQRWWRRAKGLELDVVDWSERGILTIDTLSQRRLSTDYAHLGAPLAAVSVVRTDT